jgi:glutamate-1-semialdehyde 2,1-aminomutase
MKKINSLTLYKKAINLMPGGVSSPVRAFKNVGIEPIFAGKGKGPFIYDVDNNEYIDFILSWGPLILGHSHPQVMEEVKKTMEKGVSFGLSTEKEILLAEKIKNIFPFIDKIRFVNSGTEAVMSAIRLARAYTKREKIIKFEGCYHGHSDFLLVKAGSGALTFGAPSSPGIPESAVKSTIVLHYNDIEGLRTTFNQIGEEIACVIVEPIAGNMGVVKPKENFLETLRELTQKYESLLIFDEIITGFRVGLGGVSTQKNIIPDLITLGKVIGGGFPVGAYGGKKEIMELISPEGPVYQAGTLSGNPVALTAGLKTIEIIEKGNPYDKMSKVLNGFIKEIESIFTEKGIPISIPKSTTFFSLFFSESSPSNLEEVNKTKKEIFNKLYPELIKKGILFPPSPFEAMFISTKHEQEILDLAVQKIKEAVKEL